MLPKEDLLDPTSYYSIEFFEAEQKKLFVNTWEFAGFLTQIPETNDYFVIRRADVEIIVQNCRGIIRAFRNMCPHRFSQIHLECSGNRPLSCPYHGWSFNHEGRLIGLPRAETFENAAAVKARARLKEFQVHLIGKIIFIKLGTDGIGVESFFGRDAIDFLAQVGGAIDRQLDHSEQDIEANWKLAIENSLESYHVPLVHPETLSAFDAVGKSKGDVVDHIGDMSETKLGTCAVHSYTTVAAESSWLSQFTKLVSKAGKWPYSIDGYIHYLFFPNLTITSFLGYSFHVQHFQPIGPDLTRVNSYIFASRLEEGDRRLQKAIWEPIFKENVAFTHKIFKEDEGAILALRSGLRCAESHERPMLSAGLESRVAAFQLTVRRFLETSFA